MFYESPRRNANEEINPILDKVTIIGSNVEAPQTVDINDGYLTDPDNPFNDESVQQQLLRQADKSTLMTLPEVDTAKNYINTKLLLNILNKYSDSKLEKPLDKT